MFCRCQICFSDVIHVIYFSYHEIVDVIYLCSTYMLNFSELTGKQRTVLVITNFLLKIGLCGVNES